MVSSRGEPWGPAEWPLPTSIIQRERRERAGSQLCCYLPGHRVQQHPVRQGAERGLTSWFLPTPTASQKADTAPCSHRQVSAWLVLQHGQVLWGGSSSSWAWETAHQPPWYLLSIQKLIITFIIIFPCVTSNTESCFVVCFCFFPPLILLF